MVVPTVLLVLYTFSGVVSQALNMPIRRPRSVPEGVAKAHGSHEALMDGWTLFS